MISVMLYECQAFYKTNRHTIIIPDNFIAYFIFNRNLSSISQELSALSSLHCPHPWYLYLFAGAFWKCLVNWFALNYSKSQHLGEKGIKYCWMPLDESCSLYTHNLCVTESKSANPELLVLAGEKCSVYHRNGILFPNLNPSTCHFPLEGRSAF